MPLLFSHCLALTKLIVFDRHALKKDCTCTDPHCSSTLARSSSTAEPEWRAGKLLTLHRAATILVFSFAACKQLQWSANRRKRGGRPGRACGHCCDSGQGALSGARSGHHMRTPPSLDNPGSVRIAEGPEAHQRGTTIPTYICSTLPH